MECDHARPRPAIDRWCVGTVAPAVQLAPPGDCAACAAQLEELQAMQAAIRERPPYHRAPPVAARIGASLPREDVPAPSRRWFRMPALHPRRHGIGRRAGRRGADAVGGRRRPASDDP